MMSLLEVLKQFNYASFSLWQWQLITVGFAALIACLVVYFLLRVYGRHNRQLLLEVKMLKRMEEELREKINELAHFKELVIWWEKRMNNLQSEMENIKGSLDRHGTPGPLRPGEENPPQ